MAESQKGAATDITRLLARYVANITYESLPVEVVTTLKRLLLDTLGTSLAANTLGSGCQEVVAVARHAGGSPESTLIGFGEKLPAVMAAFANGAMAHALNYDAVGAHGAHLGAIALPAPLAVAEKLGGVSGKEFLAGLAAGAELTARLAAAVPDVRDHDSRAGPLQGQLLGYFGAAASAGRVMRLSTQQMHNALGIAMMQTAGTMQVVLDGDPPAKAIYAAFPNQAGVLSVLLSKQGLGAECAAIEGEAGLFGMFYGGRYSRSALESSIGKEFYLLGVRFKPWPTSGIVHPFIEAALELAENHGIEIGAIDRIHIQGGPHIRPWCEPMAERQKPENAAAAANSVFFAVSKAFVNRKVTLGDFTEDGLRQGEAVQLAQRMSYSIDQALGSSGIVEVKTKTGRHFVRRMDVPLGHPSRSLTDSQLEEKFFDCAQYSARPLAKETLHQTIALIMHLEDIPDMAELPDLLKKGTYQK